MPKTNHAREFVGKRFANAPFDFCCGKQGERRSVKGLKRFIHSRNRASVKDALCNLAEGEDLSESSVKIKFAKGMKRKELTSGSLAWRQTQGVA